MWRNLTPPYRIGWLQRNTIMTFSTLSHWDTQERTDELEAIARDKYVTMLMSVGAERVQMLRTGERSFAVITDYTDQATAEAAQEKIANIRERAKQ
jgi:hypothetical protein